MRLYEYEVKQIFAEKGIPVPRGIITSSPTEAAVFTKELNRLVLVKAQILVGGRGKAGGILAARTPEEAEEASKKLLSTKIKGLVVKKVLIEEMLPVMKEIYLSIALDTSKGKPVLLASSEGGIDIEKVAAKYPEKIVRREVDPLSSFELYEARKFLKKIGLTGTPLIKVAETLQRLYNIFEELDATIAEINPLIITPSGDVFAAGAVLIIDDNALFRQKVNFNLEEHIQDEIEREAWKLGISYVRLDGDIGVIGSGAGLTMATIDLIKHYGGNPANFLDTGGRISEEHIQNCLKLVTMNPKVRGIIINMYGGINPIVEGARGIVKFINKNNLKIPIVVKVRGNFEEEAWRILQEAGIYVVKETRTDVAVKEIIRRLRRKKFNGNSSR